MIPRVQVSTAWFKPGYPEVWQPCRWMVYQTNITVVSKWGCTGCLDVPLNNMRIFSIYLEILMFHTLLWFSHHQLTFSFKIWRRHWFHDGVMSCSCVNELGRKERGIVTWLEGEDKWVAGTWGRRATCAACVGGGERRRTRPRFTSWDPYFLYREMALPH